MPSKTTPDSAFDVAARYLPTYHYSERHEIASVDAAPATIMTAMKNYDDREDKVLNALLVVREWPSRVAAALGRRNALQARARFGLGDFCLLEETGREISYGLVGRFWKLDYGLFPIASGAEFQAFQQPGVAKLVMSYAVEPDPRGGWRLMTQTRICCPDTRSRLLFLPYWIAIRLASGWIRLRILKQVKINAERSHKLLAR